MNERKGQKQHYVPKFLLRKWMGSDDKVGAFRKDIPGLPYSRLSPNGTGYERGTYSLEGVPEEDKNLVEDRVLKPIDDIGAKAINKILDSGFSEIDYTNVHWLLTLAASLELRRPARIEDLKEMARSIIVEDIEDGSEVARMALGILERHPEIANNLPRKNLGLYISSYARIMAEELHSFALIDFKKVDLKNRTDHLLLSDFPIIRTNGLEDPNVVVALPLSPWKVVLGFKTPEVRHEILSRNPPEILLSAMNRDSLYQATGRIYALDETPRSFLEVNLKADRGGC